VRLCRLAQQSTPTAAQQQTQHRPLAQQPEQRLAAKLEEQAGLQLLLLQTATMQQQEQLRCLFNKQQQEPVTMALLQQLPAGKQQQQQLAPAVEAAVALIQQQQLLPVLQLMIQQVHEMFLQAVQTAVDVAAQMLVNALTPHLQMPQQRLAAVQQPQPQHTRSYHWQQERQVTPLIQQQDPLSAAAALAQQTVLPLRQQPKLSSTHCKQQELHCSSLGYSSCSSNLQQRTAAAAAAEAAKQQEQQQPVGAAAGMPASASSQCQQSWISKRCPCRHSCRSPLLLLL
jgi:hypothetical protein